MSEEVSIYRTLATIQAEEEALRYCPGCGNTYADLHFGSNKLCQGCRDEKSAEVDDYIYLVDEAELDVNKAAIVRLIRNHRAEFDQIIIEETELRI